MFRKVINFLVDERPYSSKILLALAAMSIGVFLQFPRSKTSPVAEDLQQLANLEVWFLLFWIYGLTLLYGVFSYNGTAKMLASIGGVILWTGLFIFHTVLSGVGPLRGIYIVFALFSVWHTIVIYEQLRILREHKIDMTKMASDMMIEFMKKYRK